jgi:hypothetical protein
MGWRARAAFLHLARGMATAHAPEIDHIRANTWPEVNEQLDREAQIRLRDAAGSPAGDLNDRIEALDREWDFERVVEAEASFMGLTGLAIALAMDRRLLVLPAFVASMLFLHATHGWYPLLPMFRRARVRSRDEIDRERYALKALRGDFAALPPPGSPAAERADAAWKAVCR